LKQGEIGAVAGGEDDGNLRAAGADPGINLRAIEFRQDNVEQDEVNGVAVPKELVDCLLAIGRSDDFVSELGQRLGGELAQPVVIFNDKHHFRPALNLREILGGGLL
jgi:hypothetical protein